MDSLVPVGSYELRNQSSNVDRVDKAVQCVFSRSLDRLLMEPTGPKVLAKD